MKRKKIFSFKVNLKKKINKMFRFQIKDKGLIKYKLIPNKKTRISIEINPNHNKSGNRSAIMPNRTESLRKKINRMLKIQIDLRLRRKTPNLIKMNQTSTSYNSKGYQAKSAEIAKHFYSSHHYLMKMNKNDVYSYLYKFILFKVI